ncbi:hypothetical protein WMW72_26960 [Paenibacillus filicis]|uniref:Uncharacterized protein n=1 Tax=Paenibacillus filicis TaxID=669464 RepID=A0ABU9DRR0_9BACL
MSGCGEIARRLSTFVTSIGNLMTFWRESGALGPQDNMKVPKKVIVVFYP